MATGNFFTENAHAYYVLDSEDEFEYDFLKERVIESFEQKDWYQPTPNSFYLSNRWECQPLVYKSWFIPMYGEQKADLGEFELLVTNNIGYYSGSCLDWRIFYDGCEWSEEDLIDELVDRFIEDEYEDHHWNLGMRKCQAKNARKTIEKLISDAIEEAEQLCKENTETYVCAARFSNGETWYNKVS